MIKGVFFDLFGTLLLFGDMKKAWNDWLCLFHSSLQNFGLSIPIEEFSIKCDKFLTKEEPQNNYPELTIFEKRIKDLSNKLGVLICINDIKIIANLIVEKWHEQVQLDSEAIKVLKELKKTKKIGLVSNFDHPPHVHRYLSIYKIDYLFDIIIISGEVGVKKPDPNIFNPALSETNLKADQVIYVGDTEEDISAARLAKIKPVLIQRKGLGTDISALDYSSEDVRDNLPVDSSFCVISSLPELLNIVNEL